MQAKELVFDLETKHLAQDVGGWAHIDKLGLSAGVLLDIEDETTSVFLEEQAAELIGRIHEATHIIGFNILRFDYVVLKPYGLNLDEALISRTTDMLMMVRQSLGFRLSLDNLASSTLGLNKSGNGVDAVRWYREGAIDKLIAYCEEDVRVTYQLWKYGRENGVLNYRDRRGGTKQVGVDW